MQEFVLDERLKKDSVAITNLGLCKLRLAKDKRWPWLFAVPQRKGVEEVFDLTPLDQTMLTFEVNEAARALQTVLQPDKINIAMIGNKVRQLHVHIVARFENDANWPNPIWGYGTSEFRNDQDMENLARKITEALSQK